MIVDEVKSAFRENKWAIYAAIAILFISMVLGYFLEPYLYSYFNPVVDDLTQKVQQGTIKLTFQSIFLNNIRIVLAMFIFGVTCFFSGVLLGFNGFFAGYYVATTDNLLVTALLIFPMEFLSFHHASWPAHQALSYLTFCSSSSRHCMAKTMVLLRSYCQIPLMKVPIN